MDSYQIDKTGSVRLKWKLLTALTGGMRVTSAMSLVYTQLHTNHISSVTAHLLGNGTAPA